LVRVACLGPDRGARTEPATELLLRVIDDGTSTRLYETLCDRLGLCYEVFAGWEPYADVGLFDIGAEAQDDAIGEVLFELFGMMSDLAESGPTSAELDKAVQRSRWQADRAADQPESTADDVALSALWGAPLTPRDRAERLARVEPADVRRAARRLFRSSTMAVALVGSVSRSTERQARAILARAGRAAG